MITIDSRGCGEGKTTGTIYPKLKKNLNSFQKTLVVVPSINLQNQYDTYFADPSFIRKINSSGRTLEDHDSVIKRIHGAMMDPTAQIVIITQQAFRLLEVSDALKYSWHLIIDEAFDPYRSLRYSRKKSKFDWTTCLKQSDLPFTGAYIPVELDEDYLDNWSYSTSIVNLLDPLWQTYVTVDTFEALMGVVNPGFVEVYQEFTIDSIIGWASVHIAAAAFHTTPMCYWLTRNNLQYQVVAPFVNRDLPVVMHTMDRLNWSKTKAASNPEIAHDFRAYVQDYCEDLGLPMLALRNNSDEGIIRGEQRLTHNPHGINGYTHYQAISLESAINPSSGYRHFLEEFVGMEPKAVTVAFSAYMFYQCMMRTALRLQGNTKTVHVFVLDNKTAAGLLEFFAPQDVIDPDIGYSFQEPNLGGRPRKEAPLTNTERNRRWREKQRLTKTPYSSFSTFSLAEPTTEVVAQPTTGTTLRGISSESPRRAQQSQQERLHEMLKSIKLGH